MSGFIPPKDDIAAVSHDGIDLLKSQKLFLCLGCLRRFILKL